MAREQQQDAVTRLFRSERYRRYKSKAIRPFHRAVNRWHTGLANQASKWFEGEMYIEYEPTRNQYVIAGPHSDDNPDQFQIGHTAGKLAAFLGVLPVIAVMVAFEIVTLLIPLIPVGWLTPIISVATVLVFAISAIVAITKLLTLGVDYQVVEDEPTEVAA